MASNLQCVRLTCFNCGVLGVKIDPCEYCQLLPQCRKCRRRMPGRCFAKSTRPNICEVRHVLSASNQPFDRFSHYAWTNKLFSLYYKLLFMPCRIAMRGSCVIKNWNRGRLCRRHTKNDNSRLFRRYQLSDVPPSQRRMTASLRLRESFCLVTPTEGFIAWSLLPSQQFHISCHSLRISSLARGRKSMADTLTGDIGRERAAFAILSALSFPGIPTWPGI